VSSRSRSERLPCIISASRRTELVAHYPDYLARRLGEIGTHSIHTVVIWTKDPSNLLHHQALRDALSHVGQVFLHWTITGLGGTFLEPNVPPADEQVRLLDDIISYVGDPRRVHWRYDPLISARRATERASNLDLDVFRSLARAIARAGVPVVHTSFATMYPKVVRRLAAAGVEVEEHETSFRHDFMERLSAAAAESGLRLQTCCEPGFPMQRCIDGELLRALHPAQAPCRTDRARGQRKLCGCTHSLDVGHYLPCPNRCLYCYANPASWPTPGAQGWGRSSRILTAGFGMPYCPKCRFEYRAGMTRCPECGQELVPGSPAASHPQQPPPGTELVLLCPAADPTEAEIIRSALAEAGIPAAVRRHGPLTGELAAVADGATHDYALIFVTRNRLVEARQLLVALQTAPVEWPEGMEPEENADEDEERAY